MTWACTFPMSYIQRNIFCQGNFLFHFLLSINCQYCLLRGKRVINAKLMLCEDVCRKNKRNQNSFSSFCCIYIFSKYLCRGRVFSYALSYYTPCWPSFLLNSRNIWPCDSNPLNSIFLFWYTYIFLIEGVSGKVA